MLSNKKIECPSNLLNLAKMSKPIKAGIVGAGNNLAMESAKEATKKSLIIPIFIGNSEKIKKEANKLKWNISKFQIINEKIDNNTAIHGAKIASDTQKALRHIVIKPQSCFAPVLFQLG